MNFGHWNMAAAGLFLGFALGYFICDARWNGNIDSIIKSGFIRDSNAQAYQVTPFHKEAAQ